jgi:hypothetical protein
MLTVLSTAGVLIPDYIFEFKVFTSILDFNKKQSPCFLSIFTISLELLAFSNAGDFGYFYYAANKLCDLQELLKMSSTIQRSGTDRRSSCLF